MLTGQLLNSDASLNNFFKLSSMNFIPGSKLRIVFQIMDDQKNIRIMPTATASVSLITLDPAGMEVAHTASELDPADRSIRVVELTSAQTANLIGGNLRFTITDGTNVEKGWIYNALAQVIDGSC